MSVEVGDQAPDFTLVNERNEKVTLSELRGQPVVLVFFPFAFSGLCTTEMCGIRDNYDSWMDKGAKVFGISRDSRFSLAAWKQAEGFKHDLLADLKGEAAQAYGVWNGLVAERATFVIDREGKIVFKIHNAVTDGRDHSAVEAAIA